MIKNPLHQASVGLGLGVEMDHSFSSKWLINELNTLGFSVSYDEVVRYKQSGTENEDTTNMLQECISGKFTVDGG